MTGEEAFSVLHPEVREAIWKMQWKEFKPIQLDSIHAIYETKQHALICARTAAGKTEAAFLPIISLLASEPQPSVQAMYVGPLKALINDQFRRLEEICGNVDIAVHRWHGDVSVSAKKKLRDQPSGILLITPESLESNFINYGTQVPRIYRHLSFVVIDELHSFMSNVRGVHLQSLLCRLVAAAGCSPRIVGLSATIANPDAARAFIAPDSPDSVSVIEDKSDAQEIKIGVRTYLRPRENDECQEQITAEQALAVANELAATNKIDENGIRSSIQKHTLENVERSEIDELDKIAEDILSRFANSTNLIYGNRKDTLEDLADRLHQRVRSEGRAFDPFFVHHGSLSKDLREDVESKLKSGIPTTALCTSTLELGIDIGSVESIGQIDPPHTVSSMVQRWGRSGRKEGKPSILRMYVRECSPSQNSTLTDLLYPELLRAVALIQLRLEKWLEPLEHERMHLSTLTHQILSFLKQTGGMNALDLYFGLCKRGPFRSVNEAQFRALLQGLATRKLIEQIEKEIILGLEGERITASFDFYAAFDTAIEYRVICGQQEIGNLPTYAIPEIDEHFMLAGKRWRIIEIIEIQKRVIVAPAPGRKVRPFTSDSSREIHTCVLRKMKTILQGDEEPTYLDPTSKVLLRAARKTWRAVGLDRSDILTGSQKIEWFPWVGTRTRRTLLLLAQSAGIRAEKDGRNLSITYHVTSPDEFYLHLEKVVAAPAEAITLAKLMTARERFVEKFDDFVPEDLLDEANSHGRLDISGAVLACKTVIDRVVPQF